MSVTIDTAHDALERATASAAGCAALPIGFRLQEYRVDQVIGAGGFGIVYLAWDLALHRRVAIKEYMPTLLATREATATVRPRTKSQAEVFDTARRGFIDEARMLARFKHPGLIGVLRFFEQNGTAYMVMPFYQGITLGEHLARHPKSVSQPWLTSTFEPVLSALAQMHAAQCYHRDVAPDNVMVLDTGSAVLLDLGSARRVIADSAEALTVMLKPGFAPVEQYAEDPSYRQGPWTDIYALSAVLYYAITGKPPHVSTLRVMRDNVVPLAMLAPIGYASKFLAAIDKGLSIRPEDRPQSIAEFRAMLMDDSTAQSSSAQATDSVGRARHRENRVVLVSEGAADTRTTGSQADAKAAEGAARRPADASRQRSRSVRALSARSAGLLAGAMLAAGGLVAFIALGTGENRAVGESASRPAVTGQPAAASSAPPDASTRSAPDSSIADAQTTAAAGTSSSAAPSDPAGVLRLVVAPWGEILVDGVSKGVSPPLKRLELAPGQYSIELRNPGAAAVVRRIVVKPGETVSLTHRF